MFGQGSPSADCRYRSVSAFLRVVLVLMGCCAWSSATALTCVLPKSLACGELQEPLSLELSLEPPQSARGTAKQDWAATTRSAQTPASPSLSAPTPIVFGTASASSQPAGDSLAPAANSPAAISSPASAPSIRLRIYWGGGSPQAWAGSIRLAQGEFRNPQVLGVTGDAAASAIAIGDQVHIKHWSATRYGGIDIDVPHVEGNQLILSLNHGLQTQSPLLEATVSLAELYHGTFSKELDVSGNRVLISRVPGDQLPVQINRRHLIFEPGENFEFSLGVNRSDWFSQKANCRLRMQPSESETSLLGIAHSTRPTSNLLNLNGRNQVNQSLPFELDATGSAAEQRVQVTMPKQEGVYTLMFELSSPWQQASLKARSSIRRQIQVVVLSAVQPTPSDTAEAWEKIETVAITGESSSLIPRNLKLNPTSVLGNDQRQKVMIDGQAMLELGVGGWQAIPLNFPQANQPHRIEVEFLADQPISVGLSLLESSINGQVPMYGFDSGFHIPAGLIDIENQSAPTPTGDAPPSRKRKRHQFVVWPKAKQAYLLIANRDNQRAATMGNIEIFAGPERLPTETNSGAQTPIGNGLGTEPKPWPDSESGQGGAGGNPTSPLANFQNRRQFMVFSEEGLFAKNLGGSEKLDAVGGLYDDWQTFYEGADRLVQHLQAHGYSGAIITVAAEGSTLYPSAILGSSPRLDTGLFSSVGQDPLRKDVVELLCRMFERAGLTLVPAVIFNGPLPGLEASQLGVGESSQTLRPLHWNGSKTVARLTDNFPIYNPLNPQVQSQVDSAIDEIAERYSRYQCFGGLALICRPNTYTLLPGQQWCWDAETLGQFWSETQPDSSLPGNREQLLQQVLGPQQERWLQWRAQQMTAWYRRLSQTLQQHHPGSKLFLAPVDLYLNEELATVLAPSLHAATDYPKQMLRLGWDAKQLAELEQVRLFKPKRLAPNQALASNRLDVSLENQLQADDFFKLSKSIGDLTVHRVSWAHFSQLEELAPFVSQSSSLMRLQPLTPTGVWNRERFLQSLRASDAQFLVDGGALLSLGQEAELQTFRALFRQLPAETFVDVTPVEVIKPNQTYAPVIVRQHLSSAGLWFYAVNASPWPCKVKMKLSATGQQPLSIESLTEISVQEVAGEPGTVMLELAPVSMTAGILKQVNFIENYQFELPPNAADRLRKQVHVLQFKLLQSTEAQPLNALTNSYFELNNQPSLTGWELGQQGTQAISLVTEDPLKGQACLRLTQGETSPIWIRSNSFSLPETGRLSVSVWLRTPDPGQQPPLRISVEGMGPDNNYYRFGSIGGLSTDLQSNQLSDQWQRFAVHFDDLPVTRLSQVRIGLDLMGAGTVEVDRFEIFDRWFDERDAKAINQRLASSGLLLANPMTFESSRILLGSYWLRFLDEHFQEQPLQQLAADRNSLGTALGTGLKPGEQTAEENPERSTESKAGETGPTDSADRGLFRRLRRNNRIQR